MFKNILIRKQIKNTVWIQKVTILVSSEFYVIIKGSPAALCQLLEMLVGSKFQLFKICLMVQSVHQGGPFPQPPFYHTAPRIVWINHVCGRRAARVNKSSACEVESLPQSPSQMLCPVVHSPTLWSTHVNYALRILRPRESWQLRKNESWICNLIMCFI